MSIDWIGSFWEIGFHMLKSMEFGDLLGLLSSFDLIGSTKVGLCEILLKGSSRDKLQDNQ